MNVLDSMKIKVQTKNKWVQAFVVHVFIDQQFFIFLNATTEQLHKIAVLKFGNYYNFIFELVQSLSRILWKSLYSYVP